ncbi:MAG: glycoside hydrolase family 43 protein [Candidatus Azobacteroides sp.]|nr:glycoside hydrolase family 43 protein [Candidatus Azobacteroides sp.]
MKKTLFFAGLSFLTAVTSCRPEKEPTACFNFFEYRGNDQIFNSKIDSEKQYFNPILCGFYPDPSICRKNKDYYLVNSSFAFYPGIPIFTSKDLVNWEQIGHVLDRPSQLKLDSIRISGGIYAPDISYNKHNDTFYVITTCVDGIGNFVVKTKDPRAGWSDPILLPEVGGIDPSLFFDDDGKAYIVNNDAPEGPPEWDGHRAIWIHQYDVDTDKTFGKSKVIVDGGVDKSTRPVWIEGPHLYKRNGKYLLIAAEGGTSINHSEVAFLSDSVFGPYIPSDKNPILTQRNLLEDRKNKITSVGHADIIEDADGKTWAVFLGCRPYEKNLYNTGRETFLLPVEMHDNIPVILPKGEQVPLIVEKENTPSEKNTFNGNFTWRDNFDRTDLNMRWLMIRTPRSRWYDIVDGQLNLQALPTSISEKSQPAFLGFRQQHTTFEAITELTFTPRSNRDIAGLACFQNEGYHIVFGKTRENGKDVLVVDRTEKGIKHTSTVEIPDNYREVPIKLKITGAGKFYGFYVAYPPESKWQPVVENIDGSNLSTDKAGGFTGMVIGPYASSGRR